VLNKPSLPNTSKNPFKTQSNNTFQCHQNQFSIFGKRPKSSLVNHPQRNLNHSFPSIMPSLHSRWMTTRRSHRNQHHPTPHHYLLHNLSVPPLTVLNHLHLKAGTRPLPQLHSSTMIPSSRNHQHHPQSHRRLHHNHFAAPETPPPPSPLAPLK
jgi:hypothetical protein